jgi:hypothetical protein
MSYQRPKSPFFSPHDHFASVVVARTDNTRPTLSDDNDEEPVETKSSMIGCISNLMTNIIGSGIIGMYVYRNMDCL